MKSFIQQVYDFNEKAGLLVGYDDYLADTMLVEEPLENYKSIKSPRKVAREVVPSPSNFTGTDVNRVDKNCDVIFIAVGNLAKLGLSPDQINQCLLAVATANNQKLACPKDAFGKLTKNKDFVGPEAILQQILNERNLNALV